MTSPKKPRRPKSKKINISRRQEWESILKSVNKDEVPVEMLESLTVNLSDGTKVNINIRELMAEGYDHVEIERRINNQLTALDDLIIDVDFFICIDSVAATVSPLTAKLLSGI